MRHYIEKLGFYIEDEGLTDEMLQAFGIERGKEDEATREAIQSQEILGASALVVDGQTKAVSGHRRKPSSPGKTHRRKSSTPSKAVYEKPKGPEEIALEKKVNEWAQWSLTPHTPEEIREKVLDDYDGVCFAYVSEASFIPDWFLPEFAALSTGLLNRKNYEAKKDEIIQGVEIVIGASGKEPDEAFAEQFAPAGVYKSAKQKLDKAIEVLTPRIVIDLPVSIGSYSKAFKDKYHALLSPQLAGNGLLAALDRLEEIIEEQKRLEDGNG